MMNTREKRHEKMIRYTVIMVIGVLLNELFSTLCTAFSLPLWMDTVGTAFVAMTLEPAAGLIVGLVNNFYLALFVYKDNSTLIYYAVSAAVALFFGLLMRKDGKIVLKRIFLTIGAVALTSAILSTAITVWRDGGIPTSVWEIRFFTDAIHKGVPKIFACLYGVFLVKIFDSIVVGGATVLLYLLVPKKIRNAETRATTAAANITIHT
ncbi:MAG: hypothetical protein RSC76_05500 [Oscillospiraceae bacterium]